MRNIGNIDIILKILRNIENIDKTLKILTKHQNIEKTLQNIDKTLKILKKSLICLWVICKQIMNLDIAYYGSTIAVIM